MLPCRTERGSSAFFPKPPLPSSSLRRPSVNRQNSPFDVLARSLTLPRSLSGETSPAMLASSPLLPSPPLGVFPSLFLLCRRRLEDSPARQYVSGCYSNYQGITSQKSHAQYGGVVCHTANCVRIKQTFVRLPSGDGCGVLHPLAVTSPS